MLLLFGLLRERLHHCLPGLPGSRYTGAQVAGRANKEQPELTGWNKPVPEKPTLGWEAPSEENNVPFTPALRLFPLPPSLQTRLVNCAFAPSSAEAAVEQAGKRGPGGHPLYIYIMHV